MFSLGLCGETPSLSVFNQTVITMVHLFCKSTLSTEMKVYSSETLLSFVMQILFVISLLSDVLEESVISLTKSKLRAKELLLFFLNNCKYCSGDKPVFIQPTNNRFQQSRHNIHVVRRWQIEGLGYTNTDDDKNM